MKKEIKYLIIAGINALILLICTYALNNVSIPLDGSEIGVLKKYEALSHAPQSYSWTKSILFVNTCYDIDTIPYYLYGAKEGYVARTKRSDLYHVLKELKEVDSYKHIMLDIRLDSFPQGYNAYTDSIIELLRSMERISIAKSSEYNLADSSLYPIAGAVDYISNPEESGFAKFGLIQSGDKSMPLMVYENVHHRQIREHCGGLFYTDNNRLCHKVLIPTFDIASFNPHVSDSTHAELPYLNLNDLLGGITESEVKDKVIVIGDLFLHDIHDTYAGPLSGAVINANIYLSLTQGEHWVKWKSDMFLFLIYTLFFWLMILFDQKKDNITSYLSMRNAGVVKLILSFITWALMYNLISLAIYRIEGYVLNPWIPTMWFTIVTPIYLTYIQSTKK